MLPRVLAIVDDTSAPFGLLLRLPELAAFRCLSALDQAALFHLVRKIVLEGGAAPMSQAELADSLHISRRTANGISQRLRDPAYGGGAALLVATTDEQPQGGPGALRYRLGSPLLELLKPIGEAAALRVNRCEDFAPRTRRETKDNIEVHVETASAGPNAPAVPRDPDRPAAAADCLSQERRRRSLRITPNAFLKLLTDATGGGRLSDSDRRTLKIISWRCPREFVPAALKIAHWIASADGLDIRIPGAYLAQQLAALMAVQGFEVPPQWPAMRDLQQKRKREPRRCPALLGYSIDEQLPRTGRPPDRRTSRPAPPPRRAAAAGPPVAAAARAGPQRAGDVARDYMQVLERMMPGEKT